VTQVGEHCPQALEPAAPHCAAWEDGAEDRDGDGDVNEDRDGMEVGMGTEKDKRRRCSKKPGGAQHWR